MARNSPPSIEKRLSFHLLLEGKCLCRELDHDFLESTDPNDMSLMELFRCDEDPTDISPALSITDEKNPVVGLLNDVEDSPEFDKISAFLLH